MKIKLHGMMILTACAAVLMATAMRTRAATPAGNTATIARGQYLVTRVGMCGDCHTPMTPRGEPDMQHWLQGSTLMFKPTVPVPGWAGVAPGIAGLPSGWSRADLVKFLRTGVMPHGAHPNPPMPRLRLNDRDAQAVAAYLASLPSGRK